MKKFKLKIKSEYIIAAVMLLFIFCIFFQSLNVICTEENLKNYYKTNLNGNYSLLNKAAAIKKTGDDVLKEIDENPGSKDMFINAFGGVQKLLGIQYVYDSNEPGRSLFKLDNGAIVYESADLSAHTERVVNNLSKLNTYLKNKDIDFLFVTAPYKTSKFEDKLPAGGTDYLNENADAVMKGAREQGIQTLDLRDKFHELGISQKDIFFKTDHHWTPEGALLAAQIVSGYLNENNGFDIDLKLLDKSAFTSKVYKDIFLGSQGKRIGKYYAGVDDFTLLLPAYDTDMVQHMLRKNDQTLTRKGSFEKAMISYSNLNTVDYFEINTYAAYSGGDYQKTVTVNHHIQDKKILLIRDSYACTFAPFLSLAACNELHTIDTRYYKGTVKDYVDEINPDIVIVMDNPNYNVKFFDFFGHD